MVVFPWVPATAKQILFLDISPSNSERFTTQYSLAFNHERMLLFLDIAGVQTTSVFLFFCIGSGIKETSSLN